MPQQAGAACEGSRSGEDTTGATRQGRGYGCRLIRRRKRGSTMKWMCRILIRQRPPYSSPHPRACRGCCLPQHRETGRGKPLSQTPGRHSLRPTYQSTFQQVRYGALYLHGVPCVFIDANGPAHHGPQCFKIVDPAMLPVLWPIAGQLERIAPEGGIFMTFSVHDAGSTIQRSASMLQDSRKIRAARHHDDELSRPVRIERNVISKAAMQRLTFIAEFFTVDRVGAEPCPAVFFARRKETAGTAPAC